MEYVATSVVANHATWLRELLREIGCGDPSPTPLLCDNQGAIRLIHNPEQHGRTKHIDVRYHLTRKLQENAVIKTEYINTRQKLADFLTKPLDMVLCSCACGQKLESTILIMTVNDLYIVNLSGYVGMFKFTVRWVFQLLLPLVTTFCV